MAIKNIEVVINLLILQTIFFSSRKEVLYLKYLNVSIETACNLSTKTDFSGIISAANENYIIFHKDSPNIWGIFTEPLCGSTNSHH